MNKTALEDLNNLPMSINYDDNIYLLNVYVTAWNNFCIAYVKINDIREKLFSVVVDPNAKEIEVSTEPEEISTVRTFDDAYNLLYSNLISWGYIEIDGMFDYEEESNMKENVENDDLEIPELD